MIRKTRIKRTWLAAAVIASGSLLATALPANAETGVSAREIKLGITLPLTGAASPGYSKIGNAMDAYFKYVNDNGGVYGRKVTLIQKNDEYSPQLSIAKTNELCGPVARNDPRYRHQVPPKTLQGYICTHPYKHHTHICTHAY